MKDVFAIQDEISRSIVNELRLKLGRGQRRYTANVEVYDRYLKGRVLQARRGPATGQAIDLFDDVVAKDPGFAPAYAARASAYGYYLAMQVPSVGGLPVPADQAHGIVRLDALEAMRSIPCSPKRMTRSAGSIRSISNGPRPRSPSAVPSN